MITLGINEEVGGGLWYSILDNPVVDNLLLDSLRLGKDVRDQYRNEWTVYEVIEP